MSYELGVEWVSMLGKAPVESLIQLERFVAFRYAVSPVDSRTTYETREFPEGNAQRAIHRNFTYGAVGDKAMEQVPYLCAQIWNEIVKTYALNMHVVWRARPRLERVEGGVQVWCRLGGFEDVSPEQSDSFQQGTLRSVTNG
jgi:hypothetical protein